MLAVLLVVGIAFAVLLVGLLQLGLGLWGILIVAAIVVIVVFVLMAS